MISASTVKELRDKTNAGMMDCKKVLTETEGDIDAAIKLLRERGIAKAGAKAGRAATEGIISARVSDDASTGLLAEVNCETDFVSKNESFQSFVAEIADALAGSDATDLEAAQAVNLGEGSIDESLKAKVLEIGENLMLRKYVRFNAEAGGVVTSYIHPPGKVGVLIEVGTTKPETKDSAVFQELVKDLTLHIAACAPKGLSRDDIAQDVVDAEKDIFRARLLDSGKPENIIDKILEGQMAKFYGESCFLEQQFVRNEAGSKDTVNDLLAAKGKELGDTLTVTRFARFGLGE